MAGEVEDTGIWSCKAPRKGQSDPLAKHVKKLRPRGRSTWLRATQLHGPSVEEQAVQGGTLEQDLLAWAGRKAG